MKKESNEIKPLPWWTWVAPLILFYLGDYLSQRLTTPTGSLLFYLPIPIGIVLIHWWGPRILAGLLINTLFALSFSEAEPGGRGFLITSAIAACVLSSWYLFSYWQNGKTWLPDISNLLLFIGLGIIVPITFNSVFIFLISSTHYLSFSEHIAMVWTADFASSLALTLPILFYISPWMEAKRLSIQRGSEYIKPMAGLRLIRPQRNEICISFVFLLLLSIILPLESYWFIHGLFCIYIGVRFGFGLSLIANVAVFLFTYALPDFFFHIGKHPWELKSDLLNVHFGMCLLGMTAGVTGRVISDLKSIERKLKHQFKDLERTHEELDRFVYSASHDLSAPLKSIMGLISVSRLEKDLSKRIDYVDKIEVSTKKLDNFIKEILDYSRNSRLETSIEMINLRDLVEELSENFKQTERLNEIEIRILDYKVPQFLADRMRMKIILNNLLSNAIKYQFFSAGHQPTITIHAELIYQNVLIHVKDNGQGIRAEYIGKIFNMFFRGSADSSGSGLGLYIARQAAEKMEGKITVASIYGKGSVFTLHLPPR